MAALIPLVLMLGLMWMLLIRPQQTRIKQRQAMIQALDVGDEVVVGGLVGTIISMTADEVRVEIAPGTTVRARREFIAGRTPVATDDELESADSIDASDDEADR